jgi:hypothetical protein
MTKVESFVDGYEIFLDQMIDHIQQYNKLPPEKIVMIMLGECISVGWCTMGDACRTNSYKEGRELVIRSIKKVPLNEICKQFIEQFNIEVH